MEFNNKLYELRKQKGFSQEELANRLNVSRQTVSKWEVGDSTPDMEKLIAISDLFGISLDELVLDKAPEPAPAPQSAKSELYADIKEKVLTEDNGKKVRKGLKIAGIVLGAVMLVDIISFVIYVILNGFPK
ncbi:helix-turn-helix transcriptional regulator [Ruminococcus sp.]|uniref:helix-turn-helix domain-containing protein n=1 Tax=Ruminococcus sp. TaxID=41978 RepID=UPI0025DD274A|nr:helix-turn-helix transcriptional regulator [Ruminococcus sp.]MBQ6169035.1 helix-turn-helix transcriptional regulator [Ruminococcus sp.]MBR1431113.1 helix-turn-helix transcriptional regulator [Ruminococcus sp.]